MAITAGDLIEVQHYNDLALEINRLFSDNTSSLVWSSSNIILNTTVASGGESAGKQYDLSSDPGSDYLVVTVDGQTLAATEYNIISGSPAKIEFVSSLAGSVPIKVYNRETHRYGWGQQSSVYPITAGDPVLADESTLQAYLEANTNNLIDKVNVMEERTGGPNEITRINPGKLIEDDEWLLLQSLIDNDILSGSNYWKNDAAATVTGSANSFARTTSWDNKLVGVFRYSWTSYNDMRYFFNTGCELRSNLTMSGGSGQGYTNWSQVVSEMGSLILSYNTASQTGTDGVSYNLGAYDLTNSYQIVFASSSPDNPVDASGSIDEYSTYDDQIITWEARLQENVPASGNISLEIRVILDDKDNSGTDMNTTVDGTTTCNIGYKVADSITDNSVVFDVSSQTPDITVQEAFITDGITPSSAVTEIARFTNSGLVSGETTTNAIEIDGGYVITTVTPEALGNSATFTYDTSTTIYVDTGEPYNTTGTLSTQGNGQGDTARITLTWSADLGFTISDEVQDVSFRISDIDNATNNHNEEITINAYDINNNSVAVNLTGGSNLVISGNVVTNNDSGDSTPADASNSLLVEAAGPVARIEYVYTNNGTGTHGIHMSDIEYTIIPI